LNSLSNLATSNPPPATLDGAQERVRAYRLALGEFVDMFATVETFVHNVLRNYTKSSFRMSNAVFSGVRTDAATKLLRRIREIEQIGDEAWADLEPVLTQLSVINDRRNQILHHGAEGIAEGTGHVTNALLAHMDDRITSFPISAKILNDMTSDLRKIMLHFYNRHMGKLQWPASNSIEAANDILRAPWRYTPESPPRKPKAGKGQQRRKERHR
jgi:hypothetical protein